MAKVEAFAAHAVVRTETDPPEQRERRWRLRSYRLLGAGLVMGVLGAGGTALLGDSDVTTAGFVVASVCGLAGLFCALRALWLTFSSVLAPVPFALGFLALFSNAALSFVGAVVAMLSTGEFGRGRQLRKRGRIQLAPVGDNARWLTSPYELEGIPAEVAAQWRQNGRTEHASVAAFSKLSLELMRLGAPASLIASAHADALDEIRHTELCFDLARAIDGRAAGPDAFAAAAQSVHDLPRTLSLCLLAVDSLIDGALHEGVSARVIAQLARRCQQPRIRDVLRQIARDEGRHAAHGWEVVEFCLREGGEPVAAALRGALSKLPSALHSSFDPASQDGSWERWGIPGRALEQAEFAKTRAHLLQRLTRMNAARAA